LSLIFRLSYFRKSKARHWYFKTHIQSLLATSAMARSGGKSIGTNE